MDGGAWGAAVHGVAKSQARLSDFTSLSFRLGVEVTTGNHFQVTTGLQDQFLVSQIPVFCQL